MRENKKVINFVLCLFFVIKASISLCQATSTDYWDLEDREKHSLDSCMFDSLRYVPLNEPIIQSIHQFMWENALISGPNIVRSPFYYRIRPIVTLDTAMIGYYIFGFFENHDHELVMKISEEDTVFYSDWEQINYWNLTSEILDFTNQYPNEIDRSKLPESLEVLALFFKRQDDSSDRIKIYLEK